MKTLSGLLIDPHKKEISYHTFQCENYKSLYPILGCDLFDVVTLARGDDGSVIVMFIDDEGLFKPNQTFFKVSFHGLSHMPFAGKALILKETAEGDLVSMLDVSEILKMLVRWLGDETTMEKAIKDGVVDRPHTAIGSFDFTEDGFKKPSEMTRIWEWRPSSEKKEGV